MSAILHTKYNLKIPFYLEKSKILKIELQLVHIFQSSIHIIYHPFYLERSLDILFAKGIRERERTTSVIYSQSKGRKVEKENLSRIQKALNKKLFLNKKQGTINTPVKNPDYTLLPSKLNFLGKLRRKNGKKRRKGLKREKRLAWDEGGEGGKSFLQKEKYEGGGGEERYFIVLFYESWRSIGVFLKEPQQVTCVSEVVNLQGLQGRSGITGS